MEAEAKVRAEMIASIRKSAINKMPKFAFQEREDASCPHTPRSDVLLRSLPSFPHTPRSLQVDGRREHDPRAIPWSDNTPEAEDARPCSGGRDVRAWLHEAEANLRAEIQGIESQILAESSRAEQKLPSRHETVNP